MTLPTASTSLETIEIDVNGGRCIINASDFDEKVHKIWRSPPEKKPPGKKKTVAKKK